MTTVVRTIQGVFFVSAALMLGYCGFVLVDGWMFQNRESSHLEQLLHNRQDATVQSTAITLLNDSPPATIDGLIGRIEIPRLGLSAMVMEGTSRATLRHAVGHIPGMALPGQPGNIGIAGHRDTFFRPLRNIRRDDIIKLATPSGEYRYRVVSVRIVSPNDIAVLDAGGSEAVTLVTCYPFYFVGPAPDRFIVRAEKVT